MSPATTPPPAEQAERALIRALAACVLDGFTSAGHAALVVRTREHRGSCSAARCSPLCTRRWALLERAVRYLEATA